MKGVWKAEKQLHISIGLLRVFFGKSLQKLPDNPVPGHFKFQFNAP